MANKAHHENPGSESRYEPSMTVAGWLVVSVGIWLVVLLLITVSPYV